MMKQTNFLKSVFIAVITLFSGAQVNAQCSFTGLDTMYCADAASVTLIGTPEGGVFIGSGISGDEFSPTDATSGVQTINYEFARGEDNYYLNSTAGEPWTSSANTAAMDLAFGIGDWIPGEFDVIDPSTVFSLATNFVFIDGSDAGATELATFLTANITLIENWVSEGGHLLINAAPNEGGDIACGFGGTTLVYASPSSEVTVSDLTHPTSVGPNAPISATMTGSSYSHAHITGSGYTNLLTSTADASIVVLCEKAWGTGRVMFGGMTTNNFHSPLVQSANFRANLFHYMANAKNHFYLRSTVGEPWSSTSNTDAMTAAFSVSQWIPGFFESVDPEIVFSEKTAFVFIDGSDAGAVELASFLDDNRALIEDWVLFGGSLFINAAPNEGGDIDFGFDGSTLVYASPSSSVAVSDLSHPAYVGPASPTSATMTGGDYAHAHITGTGFTTVLESSSDPSIMVLVEKNWGDGVVMMGGMTTSNFHLPLTEANNWRSNLMAYMNESYDGYTCVSSQEVNVLAPIIISSVTSDELLGSDAAIDITVAGGWPAYSFDWDTDGTGDFDDDEDLTGLTAGTYTVVVEDEFGCTGTQTIILDSQVGIADENKLTLSVYPNPTSGDATIELNGAFTYQLVGINGAVLFTGFGNGVETMSLTDLADGVYFVRVTSEGITQTIKLIKK